MGRLTNEAIRERQLVILSYILRNGASHRKLTIAYKKFGQALGLTSSQVRGTCYSLNRKGYLTIVNQHARNGGQSENLFILTDAGIERIKELAKDLTSPKPIEKTAELAS